MKLYHCPPTRSQRAIWALREAGAEFEEVHVNLFEGEQNGDAFRAVNPLGLVPALEIEHGVVVESAAIAMWVFEEHPEAGLAPVPGSPHRAAYLQWCCYGPAELDHYLVTITQNTMLLPEDQRDPEKVAAAQARLAPRFKLVEDRLQGGTALLGDAFSGADVVVGHSCAWAKMVGALAEHPKLVAYLDALAERPAFRETYAA